MYIYIIYRYIIYIICISYNTGKSAYISGKASVPVL